MELDLDKQKIVIEIEEAEGYRGDTGSGQRQARQTRNQTGAVASPLGMLPNYIRKPNLYRRRKAKSGLINFFDGAYYEVTPGNFINLGYMFSVSVNSTDRQAYAEAIFDSVFHSEPMPLVADAVDMANYETLLGLILTAGVDKLKNTSELIQEFASLYAIDEYFPLFVRVEGDGGVSFNYTIVDSLRDPDSPEFNSKWKETGLTLTAAELSKDLTISSSFGGGLGFTLTGENKNKITALPSYGAATVTFTPGSNMDIILIPELSVYQGFEYYSVSAGGDFINWRDPQGMTPLRHLAYEKNNTYFRYGIAGGWIRGSNTGGSVDDYYAAWRTNRAAVESGLGGVITASTIFKPPPQHPYTFNPLGTGFRLQMENPTPLVQNRPLAIIKKGAEIFYVWANEVEV